MFFTAGKYAIMGIFPLQIPGPPWPPRLPPTLLTLFSLWLKPVYLYSHMPPLSLVGTQKSKLGSCCCLCLCVRNMWLGRCDWVHGWAARSYPGSQPGRWGQRTKAGRRRLPGPAPLLFGSLEGTCSNHHSGRQRWHSSWHVASVWDRHGQLQLSPFQGVQTWAGSSISLCLLGNEIINEMIKVMRISMRIVIR